jgi:hypothetical protein
LLIAVAVLAGLAGAGVGWWETRAGASGESGELQTLARSFGVRDVPSFVRTGYIHNSSYLGALLGLTGACFLVRRRVRRLNDPETGPSGAVATAES